MDLKCPESGMIECTNCGWQGEPEELVALTDSIYDRDFTHCPNCDGDDFEDLEDEEDME